VTLNGKNAKPSHPVTAGDRLTVMKNGFQLQFEVIDVISKRVGAPLAQLCYVDHTPEEELNKYKDWFVGKGKSEMRSKGLGRPTKRDRRDLNRFKSDYLEWDEADE
jgi:ribosome-associated heat shock protein Hsp15